MSTIDVWCRISEETLLEKYIGAVFTMEVSGISVDVGDIIKLHNKDGTYERVYAVVRRVDFMHDNDTNILPSLCLTYTFEKNTCDENLEEWYAILNGDDIN